VAIAPCGLEGGRHRRRGHRPARPVPYRPCL